MSEREVTVRFHPEERAIAAPTVARFEDDARRRGGRLVVIEDAEFPRCVIEWSLMDEDGISGCRMPLTECIRD